MVVFDTDILVAILRGHEEAVQKVKAYGSIKTTTITLFELYKGAYTSSKQESNLLDIEKLKERVEIISFDSESSKVMGKIYNDLEKKGMELDITDQFIASIAIAKNEILVTRNVKHFSMIPDLKIEKW